MSYYPIVLIPPEFQEFLQKYDRIFLDERRITIRPANFYKTIDNAEI